MSYYKATDNSIHYLEDDNFLGLLPAGSVAVTLAEAEALRPKPSLDAYKDAAKARVRADRKYVFYTLAGMQSEAIASGDTDTASAIVDIQDALRGLPQTDLSDCETPDDVDAAFVSAWMAIVAMAPANVVSAFNEVLS